MFFHYYFWFHPIGDSQGRIFLDLNPYCFRKIVDHLRQCRFIGSKETPLPKIANDMSSEFHPAMSFPPIFLFCFLLQTCHFFL
jgi:hypothetical protein